MSDETDQTSEDPEKASDTLAGAADDLAEAPNKADRLAQLIREGENMLESACKALNAALEEARAGDEAAVKTIGPLQVELMKVLRRARETERNYHDWRSQSAGLPADGEIDFDALRGTIRDRLDKLPEALGSRELPE